MESNVIWTPRVVLYTKLPLVSPDTEKTAPIKVLQTGPLTRVCEQLIPTLVWGNFRNLPDYLAHLLDDSA